MVTKSFWKKLLVMGAALALILGHNNTEAASGQAAATFYDDFLRLSFTPAGIWQNGDTGVISILANPTSGWLAAKPNAVFFQGGALGSVLSQANGQNTKGYIPATNLQWQCDAVRGSKVLPPDQRGIEISKGLTISTGPQSGLDITPPNSTLSLAKAAIDRVAAIAKKYRSGGYGESDYAAYKLELATAVEEAEELLRQAEEMSYIDSQAGLGFGEKSERERREIEQERHRLAASYAGSAGNEAGSAEPQGESSLQKNGNNSVTPPSKQISSPISPR